MPSILIFESDPTFAHELRGALLERNCSVSVVDDASVGLEQAASSPPDLILLCAELPRMNGFTVCNRLRGNASLQSVPVIIMSANSSEETFQQHRNLAKKRADDYVKKPIAVDTLLEHVERLLPLNGARAALDSADGEEVGFDDIEELEVDDLLTEEPPMAAAASLPAPARTNNSVPSTPWSTGLDLTNGLGASSDDLDAFADNAFGNLIAEVVERPSQALDTPDSVPPPSAPPASLRPSSVPPPEPLSEVATTRSIPPSARPVSFAPAVENQAEEEPPPVQTADVPVRRSSIPPALRTEETHHALAQLQLELSNAKEQIGDLEEALESGKERDQKLEALYAELDDARARLASGGGGRAKEILDLREQSNRKEKELLDLRDELTRKEKDLLATKDTSLDLERRTADAHDRAVDLEKRLNASQRAEQAATQDRDQAIKRAETHRKKAEKLTEEQGALRAEFDALRDAHQQLSDERDATVTELNQTQSSLTGMKANLETTGFQLRAVSNELATVSGERDRTSQELASTLEKLTETTEQLNVTEQQQRQALAQLNDTSAVLEQTRVSVSDLTRELSSKSEVLDTVSADLASTSRSLEETTAERNAAQARSAELQASLTASDTELTELKDTHQQTARRLAQAEEQLDQSQLQAAELAEQIDRHRVAAGEIGGLLSDTLSKLREIQPK